MQSENKVVIISGGSSGIGRGAALELYRKGYIVYDFSRRESIDIPIKHISVDVTDEEAVLQAVNQIIRKEEHIDILICNAGFGISGAIEYTESSEAHRQLEVNLFGIDNLIRAVLPHMREAKSGRIIATSSIAGIVPIPFQTWYSVSKSAILSYMLALQNEIRPYKISCCTILPGDIATGFTAARDKSIVGDDTYQGRIGRSVAQMEKDEINGMSADKAGKIIAHYALKKSSKNIVSIGIAYKAVAVLIKLLPRRISNWIVGLIYAR